MGARVASAAVAITAIWVAVILTSLFARDFVSGSEQEHIPIAAIANWFWGAISTGFVLLALVVRRKSPEGQEQAWRALAVVVTVIWLAVIFTSIFAPDAETGSDPTRIPVATMMGPIIATVATGFAAGFAALWNE